MIPPTVPPAELLERLEAIGRVLAERSDALGLVALGSSGAERERLDAYSDLDFFVAVTDDAVTKYRDDPAWLAAAAPIAWQFRNTADGYKLLFADGVFCEFAVFTLAELAAAPAAAARIVWAREGVSLVVGDPPARSAASEVEWHLGEALSNLYVGLGRLQRGETLTAQRFVQHYAVDRLVALATTLEQAGVGAADPFALERRVEQRYPALAQRLPTFVQGYKRSRESALAILDFLEAYWPVDPALAAAIRARAEAR